MAATGIYLDVAIDIQIRDCKAWLASNLRPEDHPAVRPYAERPPENEAFEILDRVSVKNSWTDKSAVSCNLCGTRRKFKDNGYVATYESGWWYIVGPDCGGAEFEGRFQTALRKHARREAVLLSEGRLRELAEKHDGYGRFFASVEAASRAIERAARTVQKNCPILYANLEAARKNGGNLSGTQTAQTILASGQVRYRRDRVVIEHCESTIALSIPCVAFKHFQNAAIKLRPLLANEGALQTAIQKANAANKLPELQKEIADAVRSLMDAHSAILDAKKFWRAENLNKISDWSADERCDYPGNLSFSLKDSAVVCTSEGTREGFVVKLDALQGYSATPPANET